jgi:hypothetical protein
VRHTSAAPSRPRSTTPSGFHPVSGQLQRRRRRPAESAGQPGGRGLDALGRRDHAPRCPALADRGPQQPVQAEPVAAADRQRQSHHQDRPPQPERGRQRQHDAGRRHQHPGDQRRRGEDGELPRGQPSQQPILPIHVGRNRHSIRCARPVLGAVHWWSPIPSTRWPGASCRCCMRCARAGAWCWCVRSMACVGCRCGRSGPTGGRHRNGRGCRLRD